MFFITVRELRSKSAAVWKRLKKEKELIITSNGKPIAVMSPVSGTTLEDTLKTARQARAMAALSQLQSGSLAHGLDKLSEAQINAEIASARKRQRL